MANSFMIAFTAVIPFVLYLTFGFVSRRIGWAKESSLNEFNTLVFKAFFPFLMFQNMYQMDTDFSPNWTLVIFVLAAIALLISVSMLVVPHFIPDDPSRGAIVQALYRGNYALFALPLLDSIYGSEAASTGTMLLAFVVPFYNVAAVIILEYYQGRAASPKTLLLKILQNPLIIGIIIGAIVHFSGLKLPSVLESFVSTFAKMCTPLALFTLGGTLSFSSMKKNGRLLAIVLAIRMVIVPIIVYVIAGLFPLSAMERFMVMVVFGTPVAAASYPMAKNMGSNGELAGELVALSTVLSVFTLFVFIFVLNMLGLMGL